MNYRLIVFYYEFFSVGGAETMMARMGKWFLSKGYKVYIFSRGIKGDVDWINRLLNESCSEFVVNPKFNKITICESVEKRLHSNDIVYFITMSMYPTKEYIYASFLKRHIKNSRIVFLSISTIIHDDSFTFVGSVVNKMFSRVLNMFIDDNILIGMVDYQTVEKEYNVKFKPDGCFKLPMYREKIQLPSKLNTKGCFNILTVSRADFPFKGYLLGLVDLFASLTGKYENLYLTIVSYGDDIEQLKEKIEKNSSFVKKRIKLIGPIKYNELNKEIADSSVYVGMGTTVLDAAKIGKPCITVEPYKYDLEHTCFWHYNPNYLKSNNVDGNDLSLLIETLVAMSDDAYKKVCYRTYNSFNELYAIDSIMTRLLKHVDLQKKQYSTIYMVLMNFLYRVHMKLKVIMESLSIRGKRNDNGK